VFSGARRTEGIGAAVFVVQSGVKDPQYVTDRILEYVRELRTVLTSMRRSQFSDFVGGLVEKKLEPDQRLAQEVCPCACTL
jgi:secreted Zn-dependent insulinase-like peptidase